MLNSNYYNIPNALNYQMMVGHYQAAANPQGKLGDRIFHAILAIFNFPPIIGQIAALFELAVVKALVGTDVKIQESHPDKKNVLNENDPVSIQRELKDINIYEMVDIKNDAIRGAVLALALDTIMTAILTKSTSSLIFAALEKKILTYGIGCGIALGIGFFVGRSKIPFTKIIVGACSGITLKVIEEKGNLEDGLISSVLALTGAVNVGGALGAGISIVDGILRRRRFEHSPSSF